MTQNVKPWYASVGVIGPLVSILSLIMGAIGYQVSAEDQEAIVAIISGLISLLGAAFGIYGRVRATHAIKTKTLVNNQSGHILADWMAWVMCIAVGAVLMAGLILGQVAMAADAHLTWEAPTKRIDGTPLQVEEIKGYEICAKHGEPFASDMDCPRSVLVDGGTTSYVLRDGLPDDGTAAFFRILVMDQKSLTSPWSDPVEKKAASRPNPPVLK